jgi:hypothetical protein
MNFSMVGVSFMIISVITEILFVKRRFPLPRIAQAKVRTILHRG